MDLERYVGTWVTNKVPIPSDQRGVMIPTGTRLYVAKLIGTQHFHLSWLGGKRAASQIHYKQLKTA